MALVYPISYEPSNLWEFFIICDFAALLRVQSWPMIDGGVALVAIMEDTTHVAIVSARVRLPTSADNAKTYTNKHADKHKEHF